MRDYVLKVAEDKKRELLVKLRDTLIEELKHCEPTRDGIDAEADDLYITFASAGSAFAEVDKLVAGYVTRTDRRGDMRSDALETVKRILEL